MKMSSGIRKAILLSLLCLIVSLLAGCELIDLVKRVVNNIYGSPSEISIVVYPPYPTDDSSDTKELIENFFRAESVKRGLMDGVAEFNRISDRTRIFAIYAGNSDEVIDFYDQILAANKMYDDNQRNYNIRRICLSKVEEIRRKSEYANTSCVIFGLCKTKSTAQSLSMVLYYYDYKNDRFSSQIGVVDKSDSQDRETDLSKIMTALLKEVYEE